MCQEPKRGALTRVAEPRPVSAQQMSRPTRLGTARPKCYNRRVQGDGAIPPNALPARAADKGRFQAGRLSHRKAALTKPARRFGHRARAYVPEGMRVNGPPCSSSTAIGPGRSDPVVTADCLGLVKLGFFVLAVDAFGAGERFTEPDGNSQSQSGLL